jgi:hypothetical protein
MWKVLTYAYDPPTINVSINFPGTLETSETYKLPGDVGNFRNL